MSKFATVVSVLALPAFVLAQAPPTPDGPPLVVPVAHEQPAPTWVENPVMLRTPNPGVGPNDWLHEDWNPLIGGSVPHGTWCGFNSTPEAFDLGVNSTQLLAGAYFTSTLGPCVPVFNYMPVTVRHGWMLTTPNEISPWRGNWEFLADVTAAQVISSYGNYLAGSSLYLRYNFLSDSAFVPYAQIGAGGLFTDAYKDMNQRAIGQDFEFILHAQVGLKYFVAPNLSLDFEGGYQHISNAGMACRNCGINALGAQIGVTYYFPWGTP